MKVTLESTTDKPNQVARWFFWLNDNFLYLDRYEIIERKTNRHKFNVVDFYDRFGNRFTKGNIKLADVPLTDEIKKEAIRKVAEQIVCKKWEGI